MGAAAAADADDLFDPDADEVALSPKAQKMQDELMRLAAALDSGDNPKLNGFDTSVIAEYVARLFQSFCASIACDLLLTTPPPSLHFFLFFFRPSCGFHSGRLCPSGAAVNHSNRVFAANHNRSRDHREGGERLFPDAAYPRNDVGRFLQGRRHVG